jgi:hypothetical protein
VSVLIIFLILFVQKLKTLIWVGCGGVQECIPQHF